MCLVVFPVKHFPIVATDFPIILSKSEYLWKDNTSINHLQVRLEPDISGENFIKHRMGFDIVSENINTNQYNVLTIDTPFLIDVSSTLNHIIKNQYLSKIINIYIGKERFGSILYIDKKNLK